MRSRTPWVVCAVFLLVVVTCQLQGQGFPQESSCLDNARVLSQCHDSETVETGFELVSCTQASFPSSFHWENSYWRSYSIDTDETITGVQFGIEKSWPGLPYQAQPIVVRLYCDSDPAGGPAPVAELLLEREISLSIGTVNEELYCVDLDVPLEVEAGTTIVVELHSPDGSAEGHYFIPGCNQFGETSDGFISAGYCSMDEPTSIANLGFMEASILLNLIAGVVDPTNREFLRGDINSDGAFNLADVVYLLNTLFVPGSSEVQCVDSADANDDGGANIADAIFMLNALFIPGSPGMGAPEPHQCRSDTTPDLLDCAEYQLCD